MRWLSAAVSTDKFTALFKPERPIEEIPFMEAAELAAYKIYEEYNDIALCLSGGVDSEFVLRVFRKLKLHIDPVILISDYNKEESSHAIQLCKDFQIEPTILHLEGKEFFTEHVAVMKEYKLDVMLGCTPIVIQKRIGKKMLTGYGDPTPDHGKAVHAMLPEWDFYTDKLDDHPGPFFASTPELFLAYLRDIDKQLGYYEAKCKLYEMPYREKIKYDPIVYKAQDQFTARTNTSFEIATDELIRLLRSGHPFSL